MKMSLLPWSLVVSLLLSSGLGLVVLATAETIAANDDRLRGQNGILSLLIAVPLSQDNKPLPDPGIFHLAAALLAVEHFNTHNWTVVREVGEQKLLPNCGLQFGSTMAIEDNGDSTTIQVVDTGVNSHQAMGQIMANLLVQQQQSSSAIIPDAIAGPYHAIPALELSVLATSLQSPLVSHRSSSGSSSSSDDSSSSASTTISDLLLLDPEYNPYYHQVTADWNAEMNFVAKFLHHYNRTNYIAIVYNSYSARNKNETKNTTSAVYQSVVSAKVDRLQFLLEEEYGMDHVRTFRYIPSRYMSHRQKQQQAAMQTSSNHKSHNQGRSASSSEDCRTVMKGVKETGYRTIVLVSENLIQDVSDIEESVHEMELDQGNHFWVLPMSGGSSGSAASNATEALSSSSSQQQQPPAVIEVERFFQSKATEDNNSQAINFLKGAAFLFPHDGYYHPQQQSPNGRIDFRSILLGHHHGHNSQSSSLFQRVLDHLPDSYKEDEELFKFLMFVANDTTTSTQPPLARLAQHWNSWLAGAAFMYDSVMSIGLGACTAIAANNNQTTAMTGIQHRNGIRSVNFMGASGHVQFGGPDGPPGSRVGSTVSFAVVNFVQDQEEGLIVARQTETLDPSTGNWIQLEYPFVFADGTHSPPSLRETPPQNFITPAAKISGICLFIISLAVVLASLVWVIVNRHDPVVVAGQPVFLYTLCFASILLCFLILISLFDETWGFSQEGLDAACCAWTWFDAQGRTLAYSALFTKLWIVNRCLRYKTRDLARWRIIWPVALVILTTTLFLTIWQIQGGIGWVRQEVDDVTGASAGFCLASRSSEVYLLPIYALQIATVLAAGIMAWKTIGMDDLYSDSKWVLGLILVQFQVLIVGGPTIAMLHDVDPTMRYLGLALLTFTFPVSAMGLIILPKILVVRQKRRKGEDGSDSLPPPRESPQEERDISARSANNNIERTGGRLERQSQQGLPRNGPRIQIVTFD